MVSCVETTHNDLRLAVEGCLVGFFSGVVNYIRREFEIMQLDSPILRFALTTSGDGIGDAEKQPPVKRKARRIDASSRTAEKMERGEWPNWPTLAHFTRTGVVNRLEVRNLGELEWLRR